MKAIKEYKVKNLLLAGGVSANSGIRDKFIELCNDNNIKLTIPNLKYCTDNATMIATVGYYMFIKKQFSDLSLRINPSLDL